MALSHPIGGSLTSQCNVIGWLGKGRVQEAWRRSGAGVFHNQQLRLLSGSNILECATVFRVHTKCPVLQLFPPARGSSCCCGWICLILSLLFPSFLSVPHLHPFPLLEVQCGIKLPGCIRWKSTRKWSDGRVCIKGPAQVWDQFEYCLFLWLWLYVLYCV